MGIRLKVGDEVFEASSYSVQEDSTPTKSDDSTGSVGVFTFSIPKTPDMQPWLLAGKPVSLVDTRRGTTIGHVTQVNEADRGAVTLQCQSRLGKLNVYNVQAQPFSGTLRNAFDYYLSLAEQDFDLLVDPQITNRPVVFPGWYGELWFYLKQMAAANDCEIALVSNVILLRPLRQREAVDHRNTSRSRTYGSNSLARAVEVYHYNNRPIKNKLVYPPGGWSSDVEVITVGSGETVERVLELSASVLSIQQPVMQTSVSPTHDSSSVYTIVGDDGLPIPVAQWNDQGGSLSVSINPDTTTLTVRVTGATGIYNKDASEIATYSVALGSDTTGNRYSTLRIVGSGVAFDKNLLRVRTCIDDSLTGTDVGISIDNPFLSGLNEAYSAGVKAAKFYAGHAMSLNGQMTTINQLGDNGSAAYPKYSYDQAQHEGKTYAQVQAGYAAGGGGGATLVNLDDNCEVVGPWVQWYPNLTDPLVRVTSPVREGTYAIQLHVEEDDFGRYFSYGGRPLTNNILPDNDLFVSIWVYAETTGPATPTAFVDVSAGHASVVTVVNNVPIATDTWVNLTATVPGSQISEMAESINISLGLPWGGSTEFSAAYVDGVYLEQPGGSAKTYREIRENYYNAVRNDFDNQVFGNANGVRVWDRISQRYYRVRQATIAPDLVDFDAEDDLVMFDVDLKYYDKTYAQEKALFPGMTYGERDRMGLYDT